MRRGHGSQGSRAAASVHLFELSLSLSLSLSLCLSFSLSPSSLSHVFPSLEGFVEPILETRLYLMVCSFQHELRNGLFFMETSAKTGLGKQNRLMVFMMSVDPITLAVLEEAAAPAVASERSFWSR